MQMSCQRKITWTNIQNDKRLTDCMHSTRLPASQSAVTCQNQGFIHSPKNCSALLQQGMVFLHWKIKALRSKKILISMASQLFLSYSFKPRVLCTWKCTLEPAVLCTVELFLPVSHTVLRGCVTDRLKKNCTHLTLCSNLRNSELWQNNPGPLFQNGGPHSRGSMRRCSAVIERKGIILWSPAF